jgi:pyruvate kinase
LCALGRNCTLSFLMRRTRILVTLGPASDTPEVIRELLEAGTDAFRLNFSHGTIATHATACRRIREAAVALGRHTAILQDLSGPKIRTGPLAAPVALQAGETLTIERGSFTGGPGRIACSVGALFTSVAPGHRLLLDDGRIELEVTATSAGRLTATVVEGGLLEGQKGINVPGVSLPIPALTDKDRADLAAGVRMGVDLAALSFVQSAEDILAARDAAAAAGGPNLPFIAKIEKPLAVERIDEIARVADGVMVARGDLGIEMPLEQLPAVQRRVIMAARRHAVPVIVATQVLESMRSEPRPTRAEVTDAAHAVDESADAIMLAGETAVGRYPVRAVAVLDNIVREAERMPAPPIVVDRIAGPEHGLALCEAAATLAGRAGASAIVALTEAGRTARLLSALRPSARIVAATTSPQTSARLALVWGVVPMLTADSTLDAVRSAVLSRGLAEPGATVVFVSMAPALGRESVNFVHVERL